MNRLILAAILALALPIAMLQGCGGGNNGSAINFVPTSLLTTAPFSFGNDQTGTLTLTQVSSNTITGVLVVNPIPTAALPLGRTAQALPPIPPGSYPVTGTFIPPNGFSVSTTIPTVGVVAISGHVPIQGNNAANYTVTAGGQSFSGNFSVAVP